MTSLASLLDAEGPRLAEMLGTRPLAMAEVDKDHCRIVGDELTLHVYRHAGDGVVASWMELHAVPACAVRLENRLHTWLVLKSRGEGWPAPNGEAETDQVALELARLARALPILTDEASLLETLLWEAGYTDGYVTWD